VGVDLGATTMLAVAVEESGEIFSQLGAETPLADDGKRVIPTLFDLIDQVLDIAGLGRSDLVGVSAGLCGLVDFDTGVLVTAPNLPALSDTPLAQWLSDRFRVPALVDNDANVAAYGEWWLGAGVGTKNMICVTLGTSVGGGIILGGKIYRGSHFYAGEFGHMTVEPGGEPCPCGNRGCLGILGSATGLSIFFKRRIKAGEESIWREPVPPRAKEIYELYKMGDGVARRALSDLARALGIGTSAILNIFDPDMVVFTGGPTGMGEDLMQPLRLETRIRTFPAIFEHAVITLGQLGGSAGALGAAGLLWHSGKVKK
jgi:glucokinase